MYSTSSELILADRVSAREPLRMTSTNWEIRLEEERRSGENERRRERERKRGLFHWKYNIYLTHPDLRSTEIVLGGIRRDMTGRFNKNRLSRPAALHRLAISSLASPNIYSRQWKDPFWYADVKRLIRFYTFASFHVIIHNIKLIRWGSKSMRVNSITD